MSWVAELAAVPTSSPSIPDRSLERAFFARPPDAVAAALLGCALLTLRDGEAAGGWIVETEAYFGADDPASHAARLKRGRAEVMAGPVGIAYVYRSYGVHAMLNVVAHADGQVGAVLIRAIEPVWGIERMRRRRGTSNLSALCAGPGRLCQALAISLDDHGLDLTSGGPVWLAAGSPPPSILRSGRIGISRAADLPLRFLVAGSRYVSGHRNGVPDESGISD